MAPASVLGALRAQGRLRRALEGWRQLLEAGCDEAPSTDSLSTMPSSCAAWTASIVSHAASEASAPGNALKGLRRRRCRSLTALCVSVLGSQAARVSKLRAPCGGGTAIASRIDASRLDAFQMTLRHAHSHRLRLNTFQMTLRRLQAEVEAGGWSHEDG